MGRIRALGADGGGFTICLCLNIFIALSLTMTPVLAARRSYDVQIPISPTPEALCEIADAMGAARFEELTVDALADSSRSVTKTLKTGVTPDGEVEYQDYQGVMGRPGVDFPVLPSIPHTDFSCKKVATGYYADLDTDCQVFHICDGGRKISFLCPNGTIFHQSHLICDWWFKVDCADSPDQYEESAEHLAADQRKGSRANNQAAVEKNFDTIHTTQRRTHSNYGNNIHSGHNHINEYKAEASFTSVAQSGGPRSDRVQTENQLDETRASPQSFQTVSRQEKPTSRQYSSFEYSSKEQEGVRNEDEQRNSNINSYKSTPTRRTMPDYTDAAIYRGTTQSSRNSKETQVVAESASFASGRGRNNYYQYNNYNNRVQSTAEPQYSAASAPVPKTTRPTYTTTYVPGSKSYVEVSRSVTQSIASTARPPSTTPRVVETTFQTTAGRSNPPTNDDSTSYSYVHYTQYPTTSIPHNHFKVTTNHSTDFRTGKAFQSTSSKDESISSKDSSSQNYWSSLIKAQSFNTYAPTVPTVTPKAKSSSRSRFSASNWFLSSGYNLTTTTTTPRPTTYPPFVTEPTVSEHAVEMIKTLEELELGSPDATTESEKLLGKRPGLIVPPSAGPNTLHSLAIYFATAVDNLVSTPSPTTATEDVALEYVTETEYVPEENKESYTSLFSKTTIEKYNDLFNASSSDENLSSSQSEEDINNDLESSQSRGPLTSSPQIRELAQVFTHALSAYLQDPETFRKVLSEIRPTDPTTTVDISTISSTLSVETTTANNDFSSVTKEDDEVLDFSDVSKTSPKTSPHPTLVPYETTTSLPGKLNKSTKEDVTKKESIQTTVSYTQQSPVYKSNTKDKTPASRIITEGLTNFEKSENEIRQGKSLSTTELPLTTSNAIAIEINGGLSGTNKKVPQTFVAEQSTYYNQNKSELFDANSSYFPITPDEINGSAVPRYGGFQNNSAENLSPYGEGVKPSNSTPISAVYTGLLPENEAIPLHWGDTISTLASSTAINPSAPSFDLVPPSGSSQQKNKLDSVEMSVINSFIPEDLNDLAVINKTNEPLDQTDRPQAYSTASSYSQDNVQSRFKSTNGDQDLYANDKSNNDNEEQLQRAHSQSFVSSANQVGRRGKKIKSENTSKNEESIIEEKTTTNSSVQIRTSNGLIVSLPTLKEILTKTTSTPPSAVTTIVTKPYVAPTQVTSTTFQETTFNPVNIDVTTTRSEPSTVFDTPRPSVKSQSSTPQYNIWSTSAALGHIWQTTVFLDPMTINDGLANDSEGETILPSANTYYPRTVTQKWNNNDIATSVPTSTTTVTSQQTDESRYSTYTTPFSIINVPDFTTQSPNDEATSLYTETQTYETFPPTFSGVTGNQQFFARFGNTEADKTAVKQNEREGKSLTTFSTVIPLQKLNVTEIDQTMMNKAKEMFGGLNATSANTLMNVMKQADKNTTVRRLILLLVQTCDDDHNKTVEASRTALLDALIRLPAEENQITISHNPIVDSLEVTGQFDSQKTTPAQTSDYYTVRRSDEIIDTDDTKRPTIQYQSSSTTSRRGKSFDVKPTVPVPVQTTSNEPSSTTVTEPPVPSTSTSTTTSVSSSTSASPIVTIRMSRRGNRKFIVKSTKTPINAKLTQEKNSLSSAERGNTFSIEDQSVPSDTRALELLRSLYSLAARWG